MYPHTYQLQKMDLLGDGCLAKEAFAEGQGMGWESGTSKGRGFALQSKAVRGGCRSERTAAMSIATSTMNEEETSQANKA